MDMSYEVCGGKVIYRVTYRCERIKEGDEERVYVCDQILGDE